MGTRWQQWHRILEPQEQLQPSGERSVDFMIFRMCSVAESPQSCMGNWQEARTVAKLDKEVPGHVGFKGTSTVHARMPVRHYYLVSLTCVFIR